MSGVRHADYDVVGRRQQQSHFAKRCSDYFQRQNMVWRFLALDFVMICWMMWIIGLHFEHKNYQVAWHIFFLILMLAHMFCSLFAVIGSVLFEDATVPMNLSILLTIPEALGLVIANFDFGEVNRTEPLAYTRWSWEIGIVAFVSFISNIAILFINHAPKNRILVMAQQKWYFSMERMIWRFVALNFALIVLLSYIILLHFKYNNYQVGWPVFFLVLMTAQLFASFFTAIDAIRLKDNICPDSYTTNAMGASYFILLPEGFGLLFATFDLDLELRDDPTGYKSWTWEIGLVVYFSFISNIIILIITHRLINREPESSRS